MSTISLESLGFTADELKQRVVDQLCRQIMQGVGCDDEGHEFSVESTFAKKIEAQCREQIDATIRALAEKHILPNVANYIENLCLQETNHWGEKKGEKVTFIEYLVKRAEAYLEEKVDYEGKGKAEVGSYSWDPKQTRITHLVHHHLHYSIEHAMKQAMQTVTQSVAKGLQETVKLKLAEVQAQLSVKVTP